MWFNHARNVCRMASARAVSACRPPSKDIATRSSPPSSIFQVSISDKEAKKRFKAFDADGNGVLSKSEFKKVCAASIGVAARQLVCFLLQQLHSLTPHFSSVLHDLPVFSKRGDCCCFRCCSWSRPVLCYSSWTRTMVYCAAT